MRVLQVVQKPQRRGPEILARQLGQAFKERGHTVRVIYLYSYLGDNPLTLEKDDLALDGYEYHKLETLLGFQPILLHRFIKEIQQFQPDLVQVNGSRTIKYGALAKRFSPYRSWKLIYRNIDNPRYWVKDRLRRLFYRYLIMPHMDGVVGVSEQILRDLKVMYGLDVPSIYIPYVVDPVRLEPILSQEVARQQLGVSQDVTVILFIGNLCEQKRPDRFLRVMSRVHQQSPKIEGWILGNGVLYEEMKREVEALDLQNVIRFWGYQSQVGPYIAASDFLLVTSDSDGIPTVVQEAGFLGKPTVTTRVGGLPECVLHGETGVLIDPNNEEELAKAVLQLIQNPKQRIEMGKRSQELVNEKFTLDRVVGKHLDFYQQLVGQV